MSTAGTPDLDVDLVSSPAARAATRPSFQAYRILLLGFTVAPILAGLDKFFNGLSLGALALGRLSAEYSDR